MKKLLLVLAIGVTFAACNSANNDNTADSLQDAQVEAVEDNANAMVDSMDVATDNTMDSAKQVAEAMKDSANAVK